MLCNIGRQDREELRLLLREAAPLREAALLAMLLRIELLAVLLLTIAALLLVIAAALRMMVAALLGRRVPRRLARLRVGVVDGAAALIHQLLPRKRQGWLLPLRALVLRIGSALQVVALLPPSAQDPNSPPSETAANGPLRVIDNSADECGDCQCFGAASAAFEALVPPSGSERRRGGRPKLSVEV